MSTGQPEWLSLPEAVQALDWIEPDVARRLIGEALSDGRLHDRPTANVSVNATTSCNDLDLLADMKTHGEDTTWLATPFSGNPESWRRWIDKDWIDWETGDIRLPFEKDGGVDWKTGEVRPRVRSSVSYRPQISRGALMICFAVENAKPSANTGRPKGSGYDKGDAEAIELMRTMVEAGHTPTGALKVLLKEGIKLAGASDDSIVRRVVGKYKERYGG
jgi:hypothetical protein